METSAGVQVVPVPALGKEFDFFTEPRTGVDFPTTLKTWQESLQTLRVLGAGCREKSFLMFSAKVYAVAAYVEGAKAAKELGVRSRSGYFEGAGDDEFCDAVLDGAFAKLLLLQLVRDVDGETFVQALEEALEPRMALSGELAVLNDFKNFFLKASLAKGAQVVLLWDPSTSVLQIKMLPAGSDDLTQSAPDKEIKSGSLCRALFEVWLGGNPVVPAARASFAAGARKLLESDELARGEFKPGGRGTL